MNGNNIEVVGWQCRCACEECVGAEWGNCSEHDYEAAMADPEMQARELVAASYARAIIAQRDARIEELEAELEHTEQRRATAAHNASAFEERMGNLQVENGKMGREVERLIKLVKSSFEYHGDYSWKNYEGFRLYQQMKEVAEK